MRPRPFVVALAAAGLVAAATPEAPPAGTARTELRVLDISVDGVPIPVDGIGILDLTSIASTDPDPSRNAEGVPFASAQALLAEVAGEAVGAVGARSDGSGGRSPTTIEHTDGTVSARVTTPGFSATADGADARAELEGATAQVDLLGDAISIVVEHAGISSTVSDTTATAIQEIAVSGVKVDLGDLVPVEDLPIDVVIGLAGRVSALLTGTVADVADAVVAAYEDVEAQVAALQKASTDYTAASGSARKASTSLATLETQIDALQGQLEQAESLLGTNPTQDVLDGLRSGADSVIGDVSDAIDDVVGQLPPVEEVPDVPDVPGGGSGGSGGSGGGSGGGIVPDPGDTIDDVVDDIGGGLLDLQVSADDQLNTLIADLQGSIDDATEQVTALEDRLDELAAQLTALLGDISGLVGGLEGLLGDLLSRVDELLSELPAVLDALADAALVDVGEVTASLSASANADGADGILGCSVANVALVARVLASPSCTSPLTTVTAGVDAALAAVGDTLAELPVVGGVVPDIRLEMFADARKETTLEGVYWVAEARVTALEFDLPTLRLGALVQGLLDDLANASLSDLLAALDASLAADADDPVLDTLAGVAPQLDAALDALRATVGSVVDVETTLSDLLATLPGPDALDGVRTPGLNIIVDPTSRAEFRASAASLQNRDGEGEDGDDGGDGGGGGGGDGDGVPESGGPAGTLPTTGGGLGLLGALAVGGALLLRRRRE